MLITKSAFLRYQDAFFRRVSAVPYTVELIVITVSDAPSVDSVTAEFVGDRTRSEQTYTFQALYEKEISDREREKYGLPAEVNGVVYFSPKQLTPALGDYHLDWNKTKVRFEGRTQVIDKIVYLDEMYGTCVGLQIFLKDDLKGG